MTTHRIGTAIKLRSAALRIVEIEAQTLIISGLEVRIVNRPSMRIAYTPCMLCYPQTSLPERTGLMPEAEHVLDIWISGKNKIFSIRWNDEGLVDLGRFDRGEWERILLA